MEAATALFTGLLGAIICYGSFEFGTGWGDAGPEPGYFPFYVGSIIVAASVFNLGAACVRYRRALAEIFLSVEQGRRIFSFFGPMFLFVLVSSFLGIYVGMILYLFGVMVGQGGYRIPKAAAISVLTVVINYLLFEVWFQVPLLKGPVEAFLGLH
jgi:NADH:ubiquinone oxidoreductase subunit K